MRHELEFAEEFDGSDLDRTRWIPAHLPHWSSREQAAARYRLADGRLILRVDEDQQPWCPEFDGATKVSSLQTAVFSGPAGSMVGQHRFSPQARVREPQEPERLYTPTYGRFQVRAQAIADPAVMVAFWMIGYEDAPERSGEICVCEIFGRDVHPGHVDVGMGVHPFADPLLRDDFERIRIAMDATQLHDYAVEWTPDAVRFFVDGALVKVSEQSPAYPMQLMLGVYEFAAEERSGAAATPAAYPKEFVVEHVRGYSLGAS